MYGLTYLYRASDFFDVVERFQPESVLFTAYWCQLDKLHLADCYEFAFMGAFGMGYKLLVLGKERVASCVDDEGLGEGCGRVVSCSNKDLWATAETIRRSARDVWRKVVRRRASGNPERLLGIRPGFLCRLDPIEAAFVNIDTFLKDKVPERVPVVCKGLEGSE